MVPEAHGFSRDFSIYRQNFATLARRCTLPAVQRIHENTRATLSLIEYPEVRPMLVTR